MSEAMLHFANYRLHVTVPFRDWSCNCRWADHLFDSGNKSSVCALQFLRHWRRLQPEVWAAAVAATLDGVLAAMPRAAHDDSALQVHMFWACSVVADAVNLLKSASCTILHQCCG